MQQNVREDVIRKHFYGEWPSCVPKSGLSVKKGERFYVIKLIPDSLNTHVYLPNKKPVTKQIWHITFEIICILLAACYYHTLITLFILRTPFLETIYNKPLLWKTTCNHTSLDITTLKQSSRRGKTSYTLLGNNKT